MTILQLIGKIELITQKLNLHPNLANQSEEAQTDNLEQANAQISEVQLLLLQDLQHGGPEKPFGIEKKEFDKLKKRILEAFAKVLMEKYKVRLISCFVYFPYKRKLKKS